MKLETLCEKRRNANHPAQKKQYGAEIFSKYWKSKEVDNLFVSFTSVDKLGVNPMSRYNTPIGIYTYPLDYVMDMGKPSNVPFAGDSPNMWIVRAVKPVLNIETYDNLHDDQIKAKQYLMGPMKLSEAEAVAFINDAIGGAKYSEKQDAARLWNIARLMAGKLTGSSHRTNTQDQKLSNDTVHFNTVLRKVFGYSAIHDPGYGIIHPSEPTQCVFLSKDSLQVVEKLNNNPKQHDPADGEHPIIKERENFKNSVGSNIEQITKLEQNLERLAATAKAGIKTLPTEKLEDLSEEFHYIRRQTRGIEIRILPSQNGGWESWKKSLASKLIEPHKCEERLKALMDKCKNILDDLMLARLESRNETSQFNVPELPDIK